MLLVRVLRVLLFSLSVMPSSASALPRDGVRLLSLAAAAAHFKLVTGTICPWCQGNAPTCTYLVDERCPTQTVIAANAASFVAGVGEVALNAALISPEYLSIVKNENLNSLIHLHNRPAPGTSFTLTLATGISRIIRAIRVGDVSMQFVLEHE